MKMIFVPSEEKTADKVTKRLASVKHEKFFKQLGLKYVSDCGGIEPGLLSVQTRVTQGPVYI